jgi:hypothetical protein
MKCEWDGAQHFNRSYYCDFDNKKFQYRRALDLVKTHNAQYKGIKLLRIDFTQLGKSNEIIKECIEYCIKNESLFYVSCKYIYEWVYDNTPLYENLEVLNKYYVPFQK